jgi:hypothetical protein
VTLAAIGIEPAKFETYNNQTWAEDRGLNGEVFFDAAVWGVDRLVVQSGETVSKFLSPSGHLGFTDPDPLIYHFPDGNAGVARHLVRALIPATLPGSTMEDQVVAMVDHATLDQPETRSGCD